MAALREINALKSGNFAADFSDIVLTQNALEKPKQYRGPGTIRQDERGNLAFKIFVSTYENTGSMLDLQSLFSLKSGQIYKADELYTLTATDYDGRTWSADRVIPIVSWHSHAVLVSGVLEVVSFVGLLLGDRPKAAHYLRLHFFTSANIPCTHHKDLGTVDDVYENFVAYDAVNCHFEVSRYPDEFVVEGYAGSPLPPFFDSRILETLQFVLARSLMWRVLVEGTNNGKYRTQFSSPKLASNTKMEPPIGNMLNRTDSFWALFGKYLEFVTKETKSKFWHICSGKLHDACEASANSLDAWALGLCVAAEGLSNLLNIEVLSEADRSEVRRLNRLIKIWTGRRKWQPALRDRALGLTGELYNSRFKDKLTPLSKSGRVSADYIKSWSVLRNHRAHGNLSDPNSMTTEEYQQIWLLMHQVTVLLYQLTFHLIGYDGSYTDYGRLGWPHKIYPLPAE